MSGILMRRMALTGKTKDHTEYGKDITNRLSRSVGHLKSVKRMVENERNCSEVLVQLAAVKSEVNNTGRLILKKYLEECLDTTVITGNLEEIKEINTLMDRFL